MKKLRSQPVRKIIIPSTTFLLLDCRTQARPQLDDLAQRVESQATWEDLILPEKTKSLLQELASQVRQRAKLYQKWGLAKRSGCGIEL